MFKRAAFGTVAVVAAVISASASQPTKLNLGAFATDHVPGELIVKFKLGVNATATESVMRRIGAKLLHHFAASGALHIRIPGVKTASQLKQFSDWLSKQEMVEYVEPNAILHTFEVIPNDPDFGKLYGLHNPGIAPNSKIDADIDAPEAWEKTVGSRDVLVAVIDTGVDYTHPDLAANIWQNPGETGLDANGNDKKTNGIDDDANGYIDDWHGWDFVSDDNDPMDDNQHGTHCSGTIGASGNDGVGVAGVNWTTSIVGLKFLAGDGSGNLTNAIKAIEYATKIGANVMSNSWGGGGYSATMEAAIKAANQKGILFVAAAGNDSRNNDKAPTYPATYQVDNVLSVAATDSRDLLANFSSYGAGTVHLAAPGVDIYSTTPGNSYKLLSGTSMATPHVAGAAALLKAAHPELDAAGLKRRLLASVDRIEKLGTVTISGGRLNVDNALDDDSINPSAPADVQIATVKLTGFTLQWRGSGDDGDTGRAMSYEVRRSSGPVLTEEDWNRAQKAAFIIDSAKTNAIFSTQISNLPINSAGYVVVRAYDNVANASELSASVPYATRPAQTLFENNADSLEGVIVSGPFGIQNAPGKGSVFSDSPAGEYGNSASTTLTFPSLTISTTDLIVSMWTMYDIESNYDFGLLEISFDNGKTWKVAQSFTGRSAAKEVSVSLAELLPENATNLQLRLHFRSDGSFTKDGWLVDDVRIMAPN